MLRQAIGELTQGFRKRQSFLHGLIIQPQQFVNDFCHNFIVWLNFDVLTGIRRRVPLKTSDF